MKRVKKLAIGVFLMSHALFGAANAANVTLMGSTVDFTYDDTLLDLFGTPSVSGNTLYFTPSNFKAEAGNGDYDFTHATVNIKVTAHTGWAFDDVNLLEKGDYVLLGIGSTAEVSGQIRVFDIASPLVDLTSSIVTTSPLVLTGFPSKNWVANASVDASMWNTATALNVTVENLLFASTINSSTLSFLEKKFVGVTIITTPVPEAETYSMMLAGLGLVGFMVARRRQRGINNQT